MEKKEYVFGRGVAKQWKIPEGILEEPGDRRREPGRSQPADDVVQLPP